jgi:hypothetical protein
MKTVDTFTATINLGLKERYDGATHSIKEVESICQEYCNKIGLSVTITPVKFIYTNGNEDGCAVGFINYPRFPSDNETITKHAISIGKILLKEFNQFRISIVCTNKTYLIEEEETR